MQAGQLRHRVQLERLDPDAMARDAHGGMVETWLPVAQLWAAIRTDRSQEIFRAQQVDARITHQITLRYRPGIETSMRLTFRGRVFHILSHIDPTEKTEMLDLFCMESA